ncbi:YrbL family protein [Caballeronia sp. LZ001]|uniref:YrbL family protein n=1 Tax=Caballeronia sp. LZ001 TaxID=3038553 RepID=UPI0038D51561
MLVDIHTRNVVYDELVNRFVLIDGIGDKTLLPLRSWSRMINRRSKLKYVDRFLREIEVISASIADFSRSPYSPPANKRQTVFDPRLVK